jgi:hypothetical protein
MHSFCASDATSVLVTTLLSCAHAVADSDIAAPITNSRTAVAMYDLQIRLRTAGNITPA